MDMRTITLILTLLVSILVHAQENQYSIDALVDPNLPGKTITVGSEGSDIVGYTSKSIQYAINSLDESGGSIILSPGNFTIESPIRLKSNTQLIGHNKQTVLRKSKGVQTDYIVDADYGELKLTVKDATGFSVGMKIQVTDNDNSSCWDVSTAFITEIDDNVIYIDDYLIRDYRSDREGKISNASSVVEIIGAENVEVSNLLIDGNKANNFRTDGCNGSGVYVFKSKNVTIDSVVVRDFNGEGISWQITENVTVKNSEISGSGNIGLHPGTGSPLSQIINNDVHDNAVDGLFICWRVHHSKVTGNRFYNNGRYGICTGHKDTDVLFENNHVYDNGNDGINLRGERAINAPHRNIFKNNIIENNGRLNGGYGISFNSPAEDVSVIGNTIRDTDQSTQKAGLYFYENALPVHYENNTMEGHELGNIAYEAGPGN